VPEIITEIVADIPNANSDLLFLQGLFQVTNWLPRAANRNREAIGLTSRTPTKRAGSVPPCSILFRGAEKYARADSLNGGGAENDRQQGAYPVILAQGSACASPRLMSSSAISRGRSPSKAIRPHDARAAAFQERWRLARLRRPAGARLFPDRQRRWCRLPFCLPH
jgi:hypothetical protein